MKGEIVPTQEIFRRLYGLSRDIVSTLDPDESLQKIIDAAVDWTDADCGSVALLNPTSGKLEILACRGLNSRARAVRLEVGQGITGWVAATGMPLLVNDVRKDSRYVTIRSRVRSELACPLEIDGHLRGVINVDSDRVSAFSPLHQEVLTELAALAARIIDSTWRYEQARHRAALFVTLTRVAQTINSSLTLEETLNAVVRESCDLIGGKVSSIMLFEAEDREALHVKATHGGGEAYTNRERKVLLEESLMGIVVRRRKPLQVSNIYESRRYQNVEMARSEGLVSLLSVPLVNSDRILGTLNVYKGEAHNFSNEEVDCVAALAELAAIAINRAQLYQEITDKERLLNQNDKLSALGLLAAEVAHEIRNPLTVIKMLFHSMNLEFPDGDPRREDARIITEKMNQLNEIVERVLRFARNSEPVVTDVDLNRELEDLISLFRLKLDQKNITLQKKFSTRVPVIRGDRLQLNQAILNIVLNAIEAMDGGGTLTLRTSPVNPRTRTDGSDRHSVVLEIRDTGKGIPFDIQKKILSPILQSTKSAGTGIGVALVKKIIDTHKARMVVQSNPGAGSVFKIYFQENPSFD